MEHSQKQKPSKDDPPLTQSYQTSPINYMYKVKIDGDHRLDFLLLLFFHQGKKRRPVPRSNHIAKLMQSSAITIKDQPIFIQTGLREYSQKQKPSEDSHPRAKRYERPAGDSHPRAKRYERPAGDFHPRAKRYEKPGKDSYPRVSMKQILDKF